MYVCIYVYVYVCMYVCVCMCVCVYIYIHFKNPREHYQERDLKLARTCATYLPN